MIHDRELLDQLNDFPTEKFSGEAFRATRINLDPLAPSYSGGRWMRRDAAAVLYTSLARDGALAELVFHWSQLKPRPTKPMILHSLRVATHRTLRLVRADLETLGLSEQDYPGVNLPRTQDIGAAVEFLGCDGLIAPSARWECDNLVLFPDQMGPKCSLELLASDLVDWERWGRTRQLLT